MQYRRSRLQGSASSLALVCPPPVCAWTTGGGGGVGCEVDESPFASISTPTAFNAALTARDFIESLHQNNKSTLLYGKNHVFVQVVCPSLLFYIPFFLHSFHFFHSMLHIGIPIPGTCDSCTRWPFLRNSIPIFCNLFFGEFDSLLGNFFVFFNKTIFSPL